MKMNLLLGTTFLLSFLSASSNGGKLSLDASGIMGFENQMKVYTYHVLSHLDHLATNKFKLKLTPKTLERLNFLENKTRTGVSFNGITDVPNFKSASENAFKNLKGNLSDESLLLLKALSSKNLKIPLALKPSDKHLPETIKFMNAFKEYWRTVDQVATLEVEKLNPYQIPDEVKNEFLERTSKYRVNVKRKGRDFLVPELPLQASEEHLRMLLENIFVNSRDFESNESISEKILIRTFLTRTFEDFGLLVYNHEFSAHETDYLHGQPLNGTNIVGILPGERWGTSDDTPLIVGAHYDTVKNTTGTIDNASGTSAVIEAARMLTSSGCAFKNSVFFVAFDLEEIGTQGSFMFVKDFLLKLLLPSFKIRSIGGALILDCVANWDPRSNTQDVPNAWEEKVFGLQERIRKRKNSGDFAAVMYRQKPDNLLAQKLSYYYNSLGDPQFGIELMALSELEASRPNDSINLENFDFFRSDHYRFWYPSEEAPNISLPALLISDTGPYRGKMATCYHSYCDTVQDMEPNIQFLAKITNAVVWLVADMASGSCGPKGLFKVPEIFQVTKDRKDIEKENKVQTKRPVVTIDGVVEILKYLGGLNLNNLDKTVEENIKNVELKNSNKSALLVAPVHRFKIPESLVDKSSSASKKYPFNKLTISIYGVNSTLLIPLEVDYSSLPNGSKSQLEAEKSDGGSEHPKNKVIHAQKSLDNETTSSDQETPVESTVVSSDKNPSVNSNLTSDLMLKNSSNTSNGTEIMTSVDKLPITVLNTEEERNKSSNKQKEDTLLH